MDGYYENPSGNELYWHCEQAATRYCAPCKLELCELHYLEHVEEHEVT